MIRYLLFATCLGTLFTSCDSKDDPVIENEEEVITDVVYQLNPVGGGTAVTLTYSDPDGDGPTAGTTTVSDSLEPNTTYDGVVLLLNSSDPNDVENVTEEVQAESDEHQFFYVTGGAVDLTVAYADVDGNGDPVGIVTELQTGDASTGTLQVILRHEPDKSAGATIGNPANAGGETDIMVTFPITIR